MDQIHEDRKHATGFQNFMASQIVRNHLNCPVKIIIYSPFFNKFQKVPESILTTMKVIPISLHFMDQF